MECFLWEGSEKCVYGKYKIYLLERKFLKRREFVEFLDEQSKSILVQWSSGLVWR